MVLCSRYDGLIGLGGLGGLDGLGGFDSFGGFDGPDGFAELHKKQAPGLPGACFNRDQRVWNSSS